MNNIRHIIKEELGVHGDVKTLAEFLHNYFSGKSDVLSDDALKKFKNKDISWEKYQDLETEIQKGKHIPKGKKVFKSEELPILKDLKIDKLIVDYDPKSFMGGKGTNAYFNSGKSYVTDKGVVGYLKFISVPQISTIYHELTHVLQFYKVGDKKWLLNLNQLKLQVFLRV